MKSDQGEKNELQMIDYGVRMRRRAEKAEAERDELAGQLRRIRAWVEYSQLPLSSVRINILSILNERPGEPDD